MPIRFDCPQCQKRMQAPDSLAGKHALCPTCGTVINVPAASLYEELPPPPPLPPLPTRQATPAPPPHAKSPLPAPSPRATSVSDRLSSLGPKKSPPPPSSQSDFEFVDDDEVPRRGKRASVSRADDDDDAPPKSRSRRGRSRDEDDPPRAQKKKPRYDDEYEDDDYEEDNRPRRRGREARRRGNSGSGSGEVLAILSLILGVLGFFACCLHPLFVGIPVNGAGLVMGIVGLKSRQKGVAIAGVILCSLWLVFSVVVGIFAVSMLGMLAFLK